MDLREAIRQRNLGLENRHRQANLLADADGLCLRQEDDQGVITVISRRDALIFVTHALRGALYHSSPDIDAMLRTASASLPETTIRLDLVPAPEGVWVFGHEWTVPRGPLVGLSWFVDDDRLQIFGLVKIERAGLVLNGVYSWLFGTHIREALGILDRLHPGSDGEIEQRGVVLRLLLAAFLFMKQRILTTSRQRPDRAQRKWAAKLDIPDSDLRIVQLRQRQYEADPGHVAEEREWSCHWLVQGHWRAQYHPSTDTHEPLFIMPYLKGDFEKPFKPPTPTVFEVNR